MAEATAYKVPEQFQQYLEQLQSKLLEKTPTIAFNPQSAGALRSSLRQALRPGYDNAIRQRQQQTAANKASIDADAAARGIGASTWVTDAKGRQSGREASDIAMLEGDYSSALANSLLGRLSEQEGRRLEAEQFNAASRQSALAQALSTVGSIYGIFKSDDPANRTSTGGGTSSGGPRGPAAPGEPVDGKFTGPLVTEDGTIITNPDNKDKETTEYKRKYLTNPKTGKTIQNRLSGYVM